LVHDLVEHSAAAQGVVQGEAAGDLARGEGVLDIVQGEPVGAAMGELRAFMFERVYLGPEATREHAKIQLVVSSLFDRYCDHPEEIPASIPPGPLDRRVTDYIAGMTDRFCIRAFEALSVPVAFAP
jgi:dGTPase